jgi:hypothetical protein
VKGHADELFGAAVHIENHSSTGGVDAEHVKNVIAAHDGEIGFGGGDFAEAHVAAVSGIELGLYVRVGEEDKIEGAWLRRFVGARVASTESGQSCRCTRGGKGLQEISTIESHYQLNFVKLKS